MKAEVFDRLMQLHHPVHPMAIYTLLDHIAEDGIVTISQKEIMSLLGIGFRNISPNIHRLIDLELIEGVKGLERDELGRSTVKTYRILM